MTSPADSDRTRTRNLFWGLVVANLVLAGLLRVPQLDDRPMHTDEAVHAVKFGRLLEEGFYEYDPREYHGPTLYFLSLMPARLAGAATFPEVTETMLRTVPVVFGLGLLLLLPLLGDALGRTGLIAAALLGAVSPILVYYSRYYIQEMLLVFFAAAFLAFGWRYGKRPCWTWALLLGLSAGLMHATKETCLFHFAAAAVALGTCMAWEQPNGLSGFTSAARRSGPHVAGAIVVALFVSVLFYSSFFRHPVGPVDSILSYFHFVGRAEGQGHEKPWSWYISLLAWRRAGGFRWSEVFILLLAATGGVAACAGRGEPADRRRFGRFLTIYTLALLLIYSVIPYKTPWLMAGVIHPATLLGGMGFGAVWRAMAAAPARAVLTVFMLAGCADLAAQAHRGTRRYAADERNPYAYSHTAPDCERLARAVEDVASIHPDGKDMIIKIMGEEYWPLPWYLRSFPRVGYWNDVPPDPRADVVIASAALADDVEGQLGGGYVSSLFGLRPGVILLLFVREEYWEAMQAESRTDSGREAESEPLTHAHYAMGTTFSITIAVDDRTYAAQAAEAAFEVLDGIEKLISHFDESSEISQVKRLEAGERYRLSLDTMRCLLRAQEVHADTGGAFDIGLGVPMRLWKASRESNRPPTAEALVEAMDRSGMNRLVLDPDTQELWTRVNGVEIDLGGIGKGYALDRMAEVLSEWGLTNALLRASHSTVLAAGSPPGQTGWSVAWSDGEERETMLLTDRAVSASGLGVQGEHILDPRTGRPVSHYLRTWAVAPTASEADALSTAFMVMNETELFDYCARRPDIVVMVLADNGIRNISGARESPAASRRK